MAFVANGLPRDTVRLIVRGRNYFRSVAGHLILTEENEGKNKAHLAWHSLASSVAKFQETFLKHFTNFKKKK